MADRVFSDLLRHYRALAGLSQEALAERAGLSVESVGALERGVRRAPYRDTVLTLGRALELADGDRERFETAAARARARARNPRPKDSPPVSRARMFPRTETSFLGRSSDIASIVDLLRKSRLVTVTGSGGVGKTRLVLEAVERLAAERIGEIRFIDLASLTQADFIVGAIGAAFDAGAIPDSVHGLIALLRQHRALLIIDNCEHLVADVAGVVAAILGACDHITILATSRERLALQGERVYRLPSLPVPDEPAETAETIADSPAVQLFIERAQSIDPDFTVAPEELRHVVRICRRLDGIPLAIELAAARAPSLGLRLLEERLAAGRAYFTGPRDLPARQQTMLATVTWSYDLLAHPDRALLDRLSVFAGGFRLEAAEAISTKIGITSEAVPHILSTLVEKSLASSMRGEHERFVLLESVRWFANERLVETGSLADVQRLHAQWVALFADHIDAARSTMSVERLRAEVRPELENVRAALEWCLNSDDPDDAVLAGRIVGGMRPLWLALGWRREGKRWAELALSRIDEVAHPHIVAKLLRVLIQADQEYEQLIHWTERATPVFERIEDFIGLALMFSHVATFITDLDAAERAVARATEYFLKAKSRPPAFESAFLQNRATVLLRRGRYESAMSDLDAAVAIHRKLGDKIARADIARSDVYFFMGDAEKAAGELEHVLQRADATTPRNELTWAFTKLAKFRLALSDDAAAGHAILNAIAVCVPPVDVYSAVEVINSAALFATRHWSPEVAARLFGFANAFVSNAIVHAEAENPDDGKTLWETVESALVSVLVEDRLASLRAEGARLRLDEALALAKSIVETLIAERSARVLT